MFRSLLLCRLVPWLVSIKATFYMSFGVGMALLLIISVPLAQAQSSQWLDDTKAPIMVDGRVLFEVGGIESFSAEQRANIANAQLERTLSATPPNVPIQFDVNIQGDLVTIWVDGRLLLTMTEGDFMVGDDPVAQASGWIMFLEQALAQAQVERTPAYQRQATIICILLLSLAIALHFAVRWLYRQLRRQIAQNSAIQTHWVSHWSVRIILQPILSYSRVVVWLGAGWYFTGLFPWSRYWRYRLAEFLQTTFTSPVFSLDEQTYSILDFVRATVLVLGLLVLVRMVTAVIRTNILQKMGASREVQDAIALLFQGLLIGIGLIIILSGLGFNLSTLAIFASVLGVGIGFGLQNIANHFLSGLIIFIERPLRVGDFVNVGDLTGTVERIGARSTEIRTLDLVTIIVPNSDLIQSKVINWSHGYPVSRLHIPFGLAYGSNIHQMIKVVMEAVNTHPEVLRYPQPQVRFDGLGDSSLDFDLLVWIRDPRQQFRIKSDLYYLLEANFRHHHLDIPFPQRDVHIHWPSVSSSPVASTSPLVDSSTTLLSELLDCSVLVRQKGDLSDEELEQLVDYMRGDGGVDISDRRYGLSVYHHCFVGADAVTWITHYQKATRDEAVRIGQLLIERGYMHHVTDEHTFGDEYLFYRFYADE